MASAGSCCERLAAIAVERDCGRLEWNVLDWNEPAIGFYKKLGATLMDEWSTFRVTGDALRRLGARTLAKASGERGASARCLTRSSSRGYLTGDGRPHPRVDAALEPVGAPRQRDRRDLPSGRDERAARQGRGRRFPFADQDRVLADAFGDRLLAHC